MTITNYTALIEQIVELLKRNDREKPQYSEKIMIDVNTETGKADAFMIDGNEDSISSFFFASRPAHLDDTWLSDMYDGLEISDIAEALGVDEQSLIYDTNVYKYGGEAEPEEITVSDVENYVYHNPALWEMVKRLYEEFQNDNDSEYCECALEYWSQFVIAYNYRAREYGFKPLTWEG